MSQRIITKRMVSRQRAISANGNGNGADSGSVTFNPQLGKWAAAVALSGRMKFLGYFDSEDAARRKVREAAAVWSLAVRIRSGN